MGKKVDWQRASEMLLDGCNFAEIADEFGVSRQAVHHHFANPSCRRKRRGNAEVPIIYPALKKWFEECKMTFVGLGAMMFDGLGKQAATQRVRNFLTGKTEAVNVEFFKKLSEVTGMTFEEMFGKE